MQRALPIGSAFSAPETEAQRYNLTHGSAAKPGGSEPGYGVGRIAVPPGMKAFPAELVPVD
jgi:hypothetical protein